jgi:hypothetical protein
MSKLTKLLRQPRRFLQDAKTFRQLLLAANQVIQLGDKRSHIELGSAEDREALYDQFVTDMARTVAAIDMSFDAQRSVAVLHENLHHLSEYLYEVAREKGFGVRLFNRNGQLDVNSATLFAIDDFACARSSFNMTIEDPGSGVRAKVEFQVWTRTDTGFNGADNHLVARRVTFETAKQYGLFEAGTLPRIRSLVNFPLSTDVSFPVDIVYTWVNHRDAGWRQLWTEVVGTEPGAMEDDSGGIERFLNRDELKFSLRSISSFAPWVRKVFVVTNCAPPEWLDIDHPKIHWVDHRDVIPADMLPVFSSHAIESRLQHVPGLADHFLYFNDDFFLTRHTLASDFFECSGLSKSFMEPYGSVNGDPEVESPDYLNAARNGRRLLEETFSRSVTRLHQHTPYALRREVLLEMEERFAGPIGQTTAGRFRSITDISTVSFLYHHYAYLTGKGLYASSDALLVKPQAVRYMRRLQQILDGERVPISVCLNDGGGSSLFPHWDRHVVEFLETYFSTKCAFER